MKIVIGRVILTDEEMKPVRDYDPHGAMVVSETDPVFGTGADGVTWSNHESFYFGYLAHQQPDVRDAKAKYNSTGSGADFDKYHELFDKAIKGIKNTSLEAQTPCPRK